MVRLLFYDEIIFNHVFLCEQNLVSMIDRVLFNFKIVTTYFYH